MFEGPIKPIDESAEAQQAAGEKPALRTMRWPELLARLEATREFRKEPEAGEARAAPCEAGFAAFSTHPGQNVSEKQHFVNQDLSTDGKDKALFHRQGRKNAGPDDREEL
jgi:hypothetical protein